MSCSVVYGTKRSNISLSFCTRCFFLSPHVSSLNGGLDGWTQFPSHSNVLGQELERNRSASCVCVRLIPSQILLSMLRAKPLGHSHWKLPKVLMHRPPWHKPGSSWHSLMSVGERKETLSIIVGGCV